LKFQLSKQQVEITQRIRTSNNNNNNNEKRQNWKQNQEKVKSKTWLKRNSRW
jgi:hypothetical protein